MAIVHHTGMVTARELLEKRTSPQPHLQDVLLHDLTQPGDGFENDPEMRGTTAGDGILHR